jgi:hypothetical protein
MIPYILAAVGGYLIGQSQKKDMPQMAEGGQMKEFKKAKSIIFPTKSEAIKRSGMLKTYYGNSARDFKVIKNGNGWAVSFEYVPNDVLGEMDGMMADGGMMAKGGIFEVGDMVKVDDSGYVKLFSGFDISQPAKIISKEKGKAFGKVRYFYGLETADGKKPFNKAQESMLTKSAEKGGYMAEGGVLAHGLREDDKIYVERGNLAGIKNDKTDEKFIVDISTGSREKLKD